MLDNNFNLGCGYEDRTIDEKRSTHIFSVFSGPAFEAPGEGWGEGCWGGA